ncbi:MAG: alpha/beta fold hydrolase [Pseudorhodoplanes sp.]
MGKTESALNRRALLVGASVAASAAAAPALAQSAPRTFVFVHGAWHGGWCWRRVSDRLERLGHKVYAPSLTGLGDRAHLITSRINVSTHITDIVNILRFEDLTDIVLVGHSYAGFVISGVAEREFSKIRSIVFVDAYVPQNGQSIYSMSSDRLRETVNAAIKRGETGMAPARAAYFNVNEKDRAYVDSKCTPQPVGTYNEPLTITGARERISKKTYIRAKGWNAPGFDAVVARLRSDPTWKIHDMPCGHDVMIDMPDRLTDLLVAAA